MLLRRGAPGRPARQWSRAKMRALLIGAAFATLLLVTGLLVTVLDVAGPAGFTAGPALGTMPAGGASRAGSAGTAGAAALTLDARDALAAKPMPTAAESASHPGPVSTRDPGAAIVLPAANTTGPAGVPAGFAPTRQGAMAQLAAIDQSAIQSGSLAGARAVITAWAMPGGPTAASWSGTRALAELLDAAGLSGGGSSGLALVVTPLMGQIKGSVGADFVIPCIDFEIDVTLAQTARGAAADCQRMVWNGRRWMIGPGSEPAPAPSVWPDTDTALSVGYRDLRRG